MESLPFSPFGSTLQDILRTTHIKNVAVWLAGDVTSPEVLAQKSSSAWETALTAIFLTRTKELFEGRAEWVDLIKGIDLKTPQIARWLMSRAAKDASTGYRHWEGVTWDTAVIIRSLIVALREYEKAFSPHEISECHTIIESATVWLYHRFSRWEEEVKYPFGPADVSQIVVTSVVLAQEFPELFVRVCKRASDAGLPEDNCTEIVRYLLHKRTTATHTIETQSGDKHDVVSYWWDDYFSTTEVVEALAYFYRYCESTETLRGKHSELKRLVRTTLVHTCTYFEQAQVEGMWGSHIDTLKVIRAYVMLRRLIPQRVAGVAEPLVIPEIHTTFKAVRWMCDQKQIFADGSFLHTLFLTIFYARALIEVYQSWEPCQHTLDRIYDDVLWFSPVRTTPERSKRLAVELSNAELQEELLRQGERLKAQQMRVRHASIVRNKTAATGLLAVASVFLFPLLGESFQTLDVTIRVVENSNLLSYIGLYLTIVIAFLGLIWKYDDIFGPYGPNS